MRRIAGTILLVLLFGPVMQAKVEKAVCPVCRVTRGETKAEPVRAVRTHEGKTYGFCSETCARTFEGDPAAYAVPVLPRPAPTFAVTGLDGKRLEGAALGGRVVLVDFWATWCAPCVKAMPGLEALHRKLSGRGLSVIGISIDEDEAVVRRHVASKDITYAIAVDSKTRPAWDVFRVKAVPAAYLIDREGRIVAQWTGLAADPKEIEAKVVALLGADPG